MAGGQVIMYPVEWEFRAWQGSSLNRGTDPALWESCAGSKVELQLGNCTEAFHTTPALHRAPAPLGSAHAGIMWHRAALCRDTSSEWAALATTSSYSRVDATLDLRLLAFLRNYVQLCWYAHFVCTLHTALSTFCWAMESYPCLGCAQAILYGPKYCKRWSMSPSCRYKLKVIHLLCLFWTFLDIWCFGPLMFWPMLF